MLEFVIVVIETIALAAIVAINVQIAKLAIHNVIQIIKHNLYIVLHFQLEKYYYMYYLALLKLQ